jgi:hypothetical protein
MISFREFVGEEFYIWGRQEYDKARNYLKNCGRPETEYDVFLIMFNKETVNLFKAFK